MTTCDATAAAASLVAGAASLRYFRQPGVPRSGTPLATAVGVAVFITGRALCALDAAERDRATLKWYTRAAVEQRQCSEDDMNTGVLYRRVLAAERVAHPGATQATLPTDPAFAAAWRADIVALATYRFSRIERAGEWTPPQPEPPVSTTAMDRTAAAVREVLQSMASNASSSLPPPEPLATPPGPPLS